jgi:hypothetical protein
MTGGRRGHCVGVADVPPAGRGTGYGRGGRDYRSQYYATGLTGWQRAQMDAVAGAPPAPRVDRMERIEQRLDEVLARLAQLEGAE